MEYIDVFKKLFEAKFQQACLSVKELSSAGSNRKYFRLQNNSISVIGTYSNLVEENEAFFYVADKLKKTNVNVPEVYIVDVSKMFYIQEDVGDKSAYQLIKEDKTLDVLLFYKSIINDLIEIQINADKGFDYSKCYPKEKFDIDSIINDLDYFKYYFIKFFDIPFNETFLGYDFNSLAKYINSKEYYNYFMYRDFQTRNIHVFYDNKYYFDFQGARKGPLQYDLASLLFSARCSLNFKEREIILDYYIDNLSKYIDVKASDFKECYYHIVLLRVLQTFGAYGFRGLYERKSMFKEVIMPAMSNLQWIMDNTSVVSTFKELQSILNKILNEYKHIIIDKFMTNKKLTVTVNSFSFRRGIPYDKHGNGGGFDCRFLPNPGLDHNLKIFTGLDLEIQNYFNDKNIVKDFIVNCAKIVESSIKEYIVKNYENISFSFGCTGGRHRSVYCSEQIAKLLQEKYGKDINIELKHWEIQK